MLVIFLVIALLALSYVLSKATDYLVTGIEQISRGTAVEAYGITTLIVSLATSLPELFVVVVSSVNSYETLALGVVMGSNIANVTLVIGGAALVSGVVKARDSVLWRDVTYAFLIGSLPLLLLFDKQLSRLDGLVLLVVYGIFSLVTLTGKKRKAIETVEKEYYQDIGLRHRILSIVGKKDVEQGMLKLTVGSVGLIVSADLIVRLASEIARLTSVPMIFVGLFMISIGATLPELTFGIKTIAKREYMMAFGNVIGSVVVNSSLILGLGAVLQPIKLDGASNSYYISVVTFIFVFSTFWWFARSKKALERWEGGVLVLAYFIFALVQILLN